MSGECGAAEGDPYMINTSSCSRRVLSSMSKSRKVTVPEGIVLYAGLVEGVEGSVMGLLFGWS
jgi:hypothetical protein